MKKKVATALVTGLVTFVIVFIAATQTRLMIGAERGLLHFLFYLRDPGAFEINPYVSPRVKLLGYDEDSLAVIGKWPWKRYVHARFLDNVEQFSPSTVLFDLLFIKPEEVPHFISERFKADADILSRVHSTFAEMDGEFAAALKRYDNVYMDLQLIEQERRNLPEAYQERIRLNEKVLLDYSRPFADNATPITFSSLEPILGEYVTHAHPVVINALPDDDGVIRRFPLFYTYRMDDGSLRNVFTVALSLLKRYYHIDRLEDVELEPGRVVLKNAKVADGDPDTGSLKISTAEVQSLAGRIANPHPPTDRPLNTNLVRFMVNRMLASGEGDKMPMFPLHALTGADGQVRILEGWEVWEAARQAGARQVQVIPYRLDTVVIDTPITGFLNVNYAGKEEILYSDPNSGEIKSYHTIPTESYKDVYEMGRLPDLPPYHQQGRLPDGYDVARLKQWYDGYCRQTPDRCSRGDETPPAGTRLMVAALTDAYAEGFARYYNKFVFTGGNATGLGDVQQTPYAAMFGVNVIINAFNTGATRHYLTFSRDVPGLDFAVLLVLCLVACLMYGLTNIRLGAVLLLASFGAIFGAGAYLFFSAGLFLSTTPLVTSNLIIFVSLLVYKLLTEERDKKFLHATFGNYLSPALIEEMYARKTHPKLGGEARNMTAFFTDIQSFSSFSELLTATQLVELLNEYLSAMTDALMAERGTLDKYEGDAIVAFFGAPMALPDHPLRACRVALTMQKELAALRQKWSEERVEADESERNQRQAPPEQWIPGHKWPLIVHNMRMRIGINTGEIVVGNMGSAMRMNYTMMGDTVNLAARLESAAKQYGTYTLISEFSLDEEFPDESGSTVKLSDLVVVRYIDRVAVVGKSEPVRIYELMGYQGEVDESELALIEKFESGIDHYLKMEWDQAVKAFQAARRLEREPRASINPSLVYINRCLTFKRIPPVEKGKEWDGVFRLTKK